MFLCEHTFLSSLAKSLEMGFLGPMLSVYVIFIRNCQPIDQDGNIFHSRQQCINFKKLECYFTCSWVEVGSCVSPVLGVLKRCLLTKGEPLGPPYGLQRELLQFPLLSSVKEYIWGEKRFICEELKDHCNRAINACRAGLWTTGVTQGDARWCSRPVPIVRTTL